MKTETKYPRGVVLAKDYTPTISRVGDTPCSLKAHFRFGSILRQVVSAIDYLAGNNDQRFVFASVENLRRMCWHYKNGKRDRNPSLREIKYALAILRKQGIISPRVKLPVWWMYRGRKGDWQGSKSLWGFVVLHHDAIAVRDFGGEANCTLAVEHEMWCAVPSAMWQVQPNAVF